MSDLSWYLETIRRLIAALRHEQTCGWCADRGCDECPRCKANELLEEVDEEEG